MRRHQDLLLKLLARLEEYPSRLGDVFVLSGVDEHLKVEGYDDEQIIYHLEQLKELGLINSPGSQPMIGVTFSGLSARGHTLLEEARADGQIDEVKPLTRDKALIYQMLKMMTLQDISRGFSFDEEDAGKLGRSMEDIRYNLRQAEDMGLIQVGSKPLAGEWSVQRITSLGHDFIDNFNGAPMSVTGGQPLVPSRKIFVVHGRDGNAETKVELFLRHLQLEPIVLHRLPNNGRHLLQKFTEEAAGASFAVVIMTPDDEGGLPGQTPQRRARQNVVFELGFFIGALKTANVAALYVPGVELPSDFNGIGYIPFDETDKWKNDLAKEIIAAGVPLDPHSVLSA